MRGRRFLLTAALATLLASAGCLRNMCEKHGYYPVTPPAQCCVPCSPCGPAPGYAAPAAVPAWNAPVAAAPAPAPTCPAGCVAAR